MQSLLGDVSLFLVSQAFISMLAKRGTVLCVDVLGTTLMFVKSTLRCPTPFSFVYCYVIE